MIDPIALVLLVLACARLTRLVTDDAITAGWRRWTIRKFGEDAWQTYLAHCRACVSVWVGAGVSIAAWTIGVVEGHWVIPVALSLSYATILLAKVE